MLRSTFSSPALWPVRLNLCNFVGILQRTLVVLLGGVGGRSIRVEYVVCWLDLNGFSELCTAIKSVKSQQVVLHASN